MLITFIPTLAYKCYSANWLALALPKIIRAYAWAIDEIQRLLMLIIVFLSCLGIRCNVGWKKKALKKFKNLQKR